MMDKNKLLNVAEVEVWYKAKYPPKEFPQVRSSQDSFKVFTHVWDDKTLDYTEDFWVLYLNRANRVTGAMLVSKGGVSGTVVDAKVIFTGALKMNASSIILAHNHPSQNLAPSQADLNLTRRLKKGGELLDISVLDHLIITRQAYYSFADEGIL